MKLDIEVKAWPLKSVFNISRGKKSKAETVIVTLTDGKAVGKGECVPYGRYGETVNGVVDLLKSVTTHFISQPDQARIQDLLPAGAARNALDCALWDLRSKLEGISVANLLGIGSLKPAVTAYTLSLDTPDAMAKNAAQHRTKSVLKLKVAGAGQDGAALDLQRIKAVHKAAPQASLIIDANESWDLSLYQTMVPELKSNNVGLIEQPFPAACDDWLVELERPIPICADESFHVASDIEGLIGKYDAVNIKLDKTGGLSQAFETVKVARKAGMEIMCGCMVSSSRSMAPAMVIAQYAKWVDLDGPLLLAEDCQAAIHYENDVIFPPTPALWG